MNTSSSNAIKPITLNCGNSIVMILNKIYSSLQITLINNYEYTSIGCTYLFSKIYN